MLPKIIYPTSLITQPSTGKKLRFRPYLVGEEKLLLIAKESKELNDIYDSITKILDACCEESNFSSAKIPIFDVDCMFLKLRSISVSNIEKFSGIDKEDNKEYNFIINFDDVNISFSEKKIDKKIQVNKDIVIVMKYPTTEIYLDPNIYKNTKQDTIYELILACVDNIFEGDTKLTFTKQELKEWLNSLNIETHSKIKEFLLNMPYLEYIIQYKNSLGNDRKWVLRSLIDFFQFL